MLISYKWLQTYFDQKLPEAEELADVITFSVFEIESLEEKNGDTLIDVKVLPDRAHYALCHRGIASEVGAALNEPIVIDKKKEPESKKLGSLSISIADSNACRRYIGRRVENISITASPQWLSEKLSAIDQRSINAVVDAANFVMFDIGQPLHAFDADKVRGGIVVRFAKEGEQIVTLDNKEIALDPQTLVIADERNVLAIAGIKGGKKAEVDQNTRNLILESANFNPILVRKTSERLGIRTDASKRFENELSPETAGHAMSEFSALLFELFPRASFGDVTDVYPRPVVQKALTVSTEVISKLLGVSVSEKDVIEILSRLSIVATKKSNTELELSIPSERLDLSIPEDIVEEVGRLFGYSKVPERLPPVTKNVPIISRTLYWESKIRSILVDAGFSEVLTSSFSSEGDVAIEKPLASDKSFLRTNLTDNIARSLIFNLKNLPLLGIADIKIFEIGKVFTNGNEYTALCVGIAQPKNTKGDRVNDQIKKVRDLIRDVLSVPISVVCKADDTGGIVLLAQKPIGSINNADGVMEINLDALIDVLPEQETWDIEHAKPETRAFAPISSFPFIVRDVAVFVPSSVSTDEVWEVIEQGIGDAKKLLMKHYLFDTFAKGDQVSFAFRLIFQSLERTLTDDETNKIMENVSAVLNANSGWKVR